MERFILHITTEETYVSGQIFAVRDFDEALEIIKSNFGLILKRSIRNISARIIIVQPILYSVVMA